MRALRFLGAGLLVLAVLFLPAGVARSSAPTQCVLQGASLGPSPDLAAFVGTNYQYVAPVGVNSVAGNASVLGYPAWFPVTIDNDSATSVANPTITVSSGLDPSVFQGTLPSPGLPSSCSQPSLPPGGEMQLQGPPVTSDFLSAFGEQESFQPGFDSSRTVTPSTVPVGGGNVTVQFAVTITDEQRFTAGQATIGVNLNGSHPNPAGTIVSLSDPTNLNQGETVQENTFNTWVLQNAQPHKTYLFSAVVHVDNTQGGPWTWVPQAEITVQKPGGCGPCDFTGSSVRVPEPDLDGSTPGSGAITLSVGDSTHSWFVGGQTSWIVTYPAGLLPDLFASEISAIGARLPATADSVASGTTLSGQRNWFSLSIGTSANDVVVTNPTITVASGYDPSLLFLNFGPAATSLPIVFSGPSVLNPPDGGVAIGSSIAASFQAPCDLSRSLSPLTVPVGGGEQTLTYTIRCTDPGVAGFNVGLALGVPGANVVSFSPPTNLDQGEQLFSPSLPVSGGPVFNLQQIVPGKQYSASFVLQVPNPFGVPFADTPNTKTVLNLPQPTGCVGCGGLQTSVSVADPTLDGPTPGAGVVTFSTGEAHVWSVGMAKGYEVDLAGTQQSSLLNQSEPSAVDGQQVQLSASWDAGAAAGTPVTFTLGSQSCTAATTDDGNSALCTITITQPVGTYTLQISSPGNISVYPASTSAPFTITGPTNADQCKNGGWQLFGIFKNQGDCVSYVATGGKNPPSGG